ncbi:hypothetical protein BSL78_08291 [Apostichopus japonicus]|uniref:Uncharacterized protein n=1 Tax=Stichopus japonicus TaxID=307972 RepID=A0A2G8L3D1_STIJA|nr:hypothetical protein BSL78_08291 [Apostichopus japonicus]
MAYVYGNSSSASVALIVFGLIQIAMFVSSLYGCRTDIMDHMHHRPGAEELLYGLDYLDFAWSSATKNRNGDVVILCHQGGTFCIFALTCVVTSLANLALILGFVFLEEMKLAEENREETEIYDLTGMTIYGVGVLASIAVLITSMVASCICCCCEKSPGKGYTVSNVEYTEHRGDDYNSNYRATSTGV